VSRLAHSRGNFRTRCNGYTNSSAPEFTEALIPILVTDLFVGPSATLSAPQNRRDQTHQTITDTCVGELVERAHIPHRCAGRTVGSLMPYLQLLKPSSDYSFNYPSAHPLYCFAYTVPAGLDRMRLWNKYEERSSTSRSNVTRRPAPR
jgi:hypothetical protein